MATTATVKEIEQPKAAPPSAGFDINEAFAKLLAVVQLNARDTGGFITFTGENPILPSNHRRGAIMAMGMMGPAAATQRGGPSQNLSVDLRNAVCHINPLAFFTPTVAGYPIPFGRDAISAYAVSVQRPPVGEVATGLFPDQRRRRRREVITPRGIHLRARLARLWPSDTRVPESWRRATPPPR